jgi:hypothetical protein
LLFQAKPDATPGMIREAIQRSAHTLSKASLQRQGYGLLNPLAALELIL